MIALDVVGLNLAIIIILITIVTNIILLINIMGENLKLQKNLRFLLSLGAADLSIAFVVMPISIIDCYRQIHLRCAWFMFKNFILSASKNSICLISLDRCISLYAPLKHKVITRTPYLINFIIILTWSTSFSITFIFDMLMKVRLKRNYY